MHAQMIQENTDLTKRVEELTDRVAQMAADIHNTVCGPGAKPSSSPG